MELKPSQIVLNAAIAGIVSASFLTVTAPAFAAKAEKGLCSNANPSCSGKGACGENVGKNQCKGQGMGEMTKAACDKMAKTEKKAEHKWMAMPAKGDDKKM